MSEPTMTAGVPERTVWCRSVESPVEVIDQQQVPFAVDVVDVHDAPQMATVIADMTIRGAGCIGACAGYGMFLSARAHRLLDGADGIAAIERDAAELEASRPTAVNLSWAVQRQLGVLRALDSGEARLAAAYAEAEAIAAEDVASCAAIGQHGKEIIADIYARTGQPVQIMTHCNAGWLAFVEHGSATAPMYAAHDAGIPIHVWVSETRPRNQGGRLTAWELHRHGVPCTVIVDNSAGHLMQHGQVDMIIVGSDRTTRCGDVANKIGTYLKAVAANDNGVPFYAAMPSSTIDPAMCDGVAEIPIEQRHPAEVTSMSGPVCDTEGSPQPDVPETQVRIAAPELGAANFGFDVTPARLVTGIITERGVCDATEAALTTLYPEFKENPS